ncbi:hypothetical protein Bpfe_001447 [Biomphalaria pfeifferi]|uniref:Uncharacterized protein n=1 Tax=Biomphalaria pfeifferi TaxID=112525 RepID=A0AAD8CAA5_BIOPF|nr:hypothetical protein Bpfe_001447 [Biomphalaria pfeifferi]
MCPNCLPISKPGSRRTLITSSQFLTDLNLPRKISITRATPFSYNVRAADIYFKPLSPTTCTTTCPTTRPNYLSNYLP